VYLPGEFGIRLEDDVYIDPDGKRMHVTPGLQQKIVCLSSI
jgi:Xaa-Pro aminopeptidase